jgi:hypothetical protein
MLLVWSLFFGLALVGADWYVERERDAREPGLSHRGGAAEPSDSEGLAKVMDDGTPIPPPPH